MGGLHQLREKLQGRILEAYKGAVFEPVIFLFRPITV